ncbi:ATP-binding protein [Kitasatospora sp. NBC_01287]|uniref:ATP-binding protein n=1 Tax=Kitasatospora sp. NBC_01287 TaxID=2903573 RepID=UPI00225B6047|nr:ATP-binding protein [Kitasatospora sp. NBC_01287]MCX4745911.1 ATP-binding protein [Kitasatospora sp. NBC_01287]
MNAQRGPVHRIIVNATSPDLAERLERVGPVKRALGTVLEDWGIAPRAVRLDILTVVHELVVNAVRHAPPGWLQAALRLSPDGHRLVVEVHDPDHRVPAIGTAAFANAHAESGRGLLMVAALSQRWGAQRTTSGKRVWAELALPAAPPVPELSRAVGRVQIITDVVSASRVLAPTFSTTSPHLN